MLMHSQSEFPLWYLYFLLPTMFALGLALAPIASPGDQFEVISKEADFPAWRRPHRGLLAAGVLMVAGAAATLYDYEKLLGIVEPDSNSERLMQRVEVADLGAFRSYCRSLCRNAGTSRQQIPEPYRRATHEMLDPRLLISWAMALAEHGEVDRARYIAARVRGSTTPL